MKRSKEAVLKKCCLHFSPKLTPDKLQCLYQINFQETLHHSKYVIFSCPIRPYCLFRLSGIPASDYHKAESEQKAETGT